MANSFVNLNLNNTNIRQFTSHDIENSSIPVEKINRIVIDSEPTIINVMGATPEATRSVQVIYVTLDVESTQKIGYSCDETVKKLPIYILFKGQPEQREFYVGKTGMFEIQPETQKNVNGTEYDDLNGRIYSMEIEYIRVPYKYRIL